MLVDAIFSRNDSPAKRIERLIKDARSSFDAALYRLNSQRLAKAVKDAHERGLQVRLVLDSNKYQESQATRQLLADRDIPFRVSYGRDGSGSKMHHKFAILDGAIVLTGSYNWTFASEEQNHENLLIVREAEVVEAYRSEFDRLWSAAKQV
jgi:phosphatidylserine/phosphatidylglycerophosphate/cardiolipin synthase-like enzyme